MSIKMTRYIKITSAVAGASAVAQQRLYGRMFTTDARLPVGEMLTVRSGGADDYFGSSSDEAAFAREYFSYISPAPASQAPELQFAPWVKDDRPTRIYSVEGMRTSLADFQAFTTGKLSVIVDGNTYTLTGIDLHEEPSISDVCSAIGGALAIAAEDKTSATFSFDPVRKQFVMKSTKNGVQGVMEVVPLVGDADDMSAHLGLVDNVLVSPGADAETPLEAFRRAENLTDSFGSATFPKGEVELEDAQALSAYVSGENVKYQMYWSVTKDTAADWFEGLGGTASTGLILNDTNGENKVALPMAILAAVDYDRNDATVNYMYRQPGLTWTADVMSDSDADLYDNMRVNYYGQTATAGQRIAFFQRGVLCGPATAPLTMSVHANEQWFKASVLADLMALFLTTGKVPANNIGKGMVLNVIQDTIDQALTNGTIILGKTLTALQKVAITTLTGDETAWHNIQNDGYWASASVVESTGPSGITEYTIKYLVVYSKGDVVNKIEGSHNLI